MFISIEILFTDKKSSLCGTCTIKLNDDITKKIIKFIE